MENPLIKINRQLAYEQLVDIGIDPMCAAHYAFNYTNWMLWNMNVGIK